MLERDLVVQIVLGRRLRHDRLDPKTVDRLACVLRADSDEWNGRKIKINAVRTQYAGKSIDGLRVEPIVPKAAAKDDLNDEIAF